MIDVRKLLQAKKADQVQTNLATAKAEYETAIKDLEQLQQQRQDQLLEASDDQIDQLDQQIAQTQRQIDRLDAAIAKLAAQLSEQQRAERKAAVEKQLADARTQVEHAANGLMKRYRDKAGELAAVLAEMQAADQAAEAANAAGQEAVLDGMIDGFDRVPTLERTLDADGRVAAPYKVIDLPDPRNRNARAPEFPNIW
jgi:chromosome segregation ATPase